MDSEKDLLKRFSELHSRAEIRNTYEYSKFLGVGEQSLLLNAGMLPSPALFGGYDEAERKIAIFGNEENRGYYETPPISCIKAAPKVAKFADSLTHRDFLGAIMNLGIERSFVGDIIINDNVGYIFCLTDMAEYIEAELSRAKHTALECEILSDIPEFAKPKVEEICFTAASERLDLIIGEVFNLSRNDSKEIVLGERVTVDSKIIANPSFVLKEGNRVSVRGKGKFIYLGNEGLSKKGKLKLRVGIFK